MSDPKDQMTRVFQSWTDGQRKLFETQMKAFDAFTKVAGQKAGAGDDGGAGGFPMPDLSAMPDLSSLSAQSAEMIEKASGDFFERWKAFAGHWNADAGPDDVARLTLNKFLDPSAWFNVEGDELNATLRRLVEGGDFGDGWLRELKFLRTSKEWMTLRERSRAYRQVMSLAWMRAFRRFMAELAPGADGKPKAENWNQALDLWLDISNKELIKTQRTEDYLNAQRELIRAGVDYRLHERELIEDFSELHSIPTRTEVDELHATVTELRREVRALKRQLAEPAKTRAKPPAKPKARRARTASRSKGAKS